LESIPGVGEATIAQILSFMGVPKRFKNARQLAAFVGLNPKKHESGSSVRGRSRLSKTGDSALRKALYMPAISAKKYNPVIKAFCERLQKAGKPPMVIIGAAMRKLLHLIYGVLKSGKPFNANLAIA
jgi:transposase